MHGRETPSSPQAAVVVVNWNGKHWLESCLQSLAAQTFTAFELVVVDNGSTDGSVAWLQAHPLRPQVIANERNLGFAAANNQGIRATTAPLVVTLNNDTRLEPDWLGQMVAAAGQTEAGMVAARVVRWDAPEIIDSAGILVDYAGIAWNRGWGRPANQYNTPATVFGPNAAAALYRRAMLDQIGLFDERFFAYYEDVDLAWRAQRAGWRCLYTPTSPVYHHHSATGHRLGAGKIRLLSRNKWLTLCKNFNRRGHWWAIPLVLGYDLAALLYQTAASRSLAAWQGRREAWALCRHLSLPTPSEPPIPLSWPPPFAGQSR